MPLNAAHPLPDERVLCLTFEQILNGKYENELC